LSASSGGPRKLDPQISLEVDRFTGSSREQLVEYLAESAARLKTLEEKLRGAELENRYLRKLLRLAWIEKYGPGSEKIVRLATGASGARTRSESSRSAGRERASTAQAAASQSASAGQASWSTGIEKTIACTPERCVCSQCGKDKDLIGYETRQQLDVEPAKHFVLVTKREKRACRRCEEQDVESAAIPARFLSRDVNAFDACGRREAQLFECR
jgi:transposase